MKTYDECKIQSYVFNGFVLGKLRENKDWSEDQEGREEVL